MMRDERVLKVKVRTEREGRRVKNKRMRRPVNKQLPHQRTGELSKLPPGTPYIYYRPLGSFCVEGRSSIHRTLPLELTRWVVIALSCFLYSRKKKKANK